MCVKRGVQDSQHTQSNVILWGEGREGVWDGVEWGEGDEVKDGVE